MWLTMLKKNEVAFFGVTIAFFINFLWEMKTKNPGHNQPIPAGNGILIPGS